MRSGFFMKATCVGVAIWTGVACSTVTKPCTQGGDPALDRKIGGTKQCYQRKDPSGHYVNQGAYLEWYPNGKRAVEGEYSWGRKNGKWTEWDETGKKISEKWYDNGVETPTRETTQSKK